MRRTPRTLGALATIGAALLISGCGRDVPASALIGTSQTPPADRQQLPTIAGKDLAGSDLDLARLRGKVVVLNGWASWCGPCRDEIPGFVDLAASVDPDDIAVVGLNVSDETAAATAFAAEMGMTYPSIVDQQGTLLATIPGIPPKALPSTVILDRQGRIAETIVGVAEPAALQAAVSAVAAEPN